MGQPTRQIARNLARGAEHRTAVMPETVPPQETLTVEEWRADIERLVKSGAKPRSIYEWLKREREKFSGSYPAVKRLCRSLGAAQGPREEDVAIPVDAPPGEAQVEFGYLAVVRAAFAVDERAALHRSYREVARQYSCRIDPAPPRSPKKKGRVEAGVGYLRRNFLPTLTSRDVGDAADALQRWTTQTANQRIHGTTGKRPADAFERDYRPALLALPAARFESVIWKQALVHRDSHLEFGRRLYSVPWCFIGKSVWLRATSDRVAVYYDDARISTHARRGKGPRSTFPGHLPEHRAELGQRRSPPTCRTTSAASSTRTTR